MASIQKRGKKFAVVYTYEDTEGVKRQKWETLTTKKEALARKAQIENEINKGVFIAPNELCVRDFLKEFVEIYGAKKWGLSAYSSNVSLIENYINPIIGNTNIQDINRRAVDSFVMKLQKTPPIETPYRHARTEYVTPCTIEKIIKLLHCAFRQAVRWDMIPKNPFEDVLLPKREKKQREIWTADTIRKALDSCTDGKLYVAINLAFACSLRLGEITGLTWDCGHITDKDIANDDAHLMVEKELARVNQQSIDALGNQFERLKKSAGLPDVVFHSLRHSSTTYKLKLNHGNIKATQDDTGHVQADMVTDLYAHILDEDRKINAQRFEAAFYANPDMRKVEREIVEQSKPQPQAAAVDLQQLFAQLQQNPEVLGQLAALLKGA